MKCVIHRRNSYPENVGHWRRSVALVVPLAKVSARPRKESTKTFGKTSCHLPVNIRAARRWMPGLGEVLNDRTPCLAACDPRHSCQIHRAANYPVMFRGTADRCRVSQELRSKRRCWSVNKGTREARLSRVVAQLSRLIDGLKHLPMRQPSGGAPVVVGDANDVHMAKGCRMIRDWMTEVFFNLEASK